MTSLMIYGLVVGALVALGARATEEVCRLGGFQRRWVWAAALVLTVGLIAAAPGRTTIAPTASVQSAGEPSSALTQSSAPPSIAKRLADSAYGTLTGFAAAPLSRAAAFAERSGGPQVDPLISAAWLTLSILVLLVFVWTARRCSALRRSAPIGHLLGKRVRVTGRLGPAVMGLIHPEIVIPGWLLAAPIAEQKLVIAHETEHCRARDPLVLLVGAVAVVLLPWHPAVWWMAARLRLATEVDCDDRVLGRGAEPLAYGQLLIAVAARSSGIPLGAPALIDSASHLKRRLHAMIPVSRRFVAVRGLLSGLLAVSTVLAACETLPPTAAEIEQMDVAAAEEGARSIGLLSPDPTAGEAEYVVNGRVVTPAEARAIPRNNIATILVRNPEDPEWPSQVLIETRDAPPGARLGPEFGHSGPQTDSGIAHDGEAREGPRPFNTEVEPVPLPAAGPNPLILIDGRRADAAELQALNRSPRVASVQIIKGSEALAAYGVEGAGGVVLVSTMARNPGAPHKSARSGRVAGLVVDAAGSPVAGARVAVRGQEVGALTNADGRFAITSLAPGSYTLDVSLGDGQESASATVIVKEGPAVNAEIRLPRRGGR